jgi:Cu-Zn family superoxide dismutase
LVSFSVFAGLVMDLSAEGKAPPPVSKAVAVLHPSSGSDARGVVIFTEIGNDVRVTVEAKGLTPGKHGFHIHQFGDCSAPDAVSAGPHFNPTDMPHGGPEERNRHVGDLGNITAGEDGIVRENLVDSIIALNGPNSIIGRAVVIHAKQDDLKSQPSGEAGARIACGVIGIAEPLAIRGPETVK